MLAEDKSAFTQLLAATMAIYERQITTGLADIFFSAMAPYDLATVREALNRHVQDPDGGRFAPKPADLIRQIQNGQASDGRPGREEAWAIAQLAADESRTVVLSGEIIGALEVARPLLEARDKVAARLAFCEAYDRLVREKRAECVPLEWHVSLGYDKAGRVPAIEQAREPGRLDAPKAALLIEQNREESISADGVAIAGLLSGPKAKDPQDLRARWQALRSQVQGKVSEDKRKARTEEMRRAEQELEAMKGKDL